MKKYSKDLSTSKWQIIVEVAEDGTIKEQLFRAKTTPETIKQCDLMYSLLVKVNKFEEKIQRVYEAGHWGIDHVGQANYASRQAEAEKKLEDAMHG